MVTRLGRAAEANRLGRRGDCAPECEPRGAVQAREAKDAWLVFASEPFQLVFAIGPIRNPAPTHSALIRCRNITERFYSNLFAPTKQTAPQFEVPLALLSNSYPNHHLKQFRWFWE